MGICKTVFLQIWLHGIISRIIFTSILLALVFDCAVNSRKQLSTDQPYEIRANSGRPADSHSELDQDEFSVDREAIKDFYFDKKEGVIFLVDQPTVLSEQDIDKDFALVSERSKTTPEKATLENFKANNSINSSFTTEVCNPPRCYLVSELEAKSIFEDDKNRLKKKEQIPTLEGAIRLSRVGFNPEKTEALIYIDRYSGPKSGAGEVMFLKKESGHWTILERFELWLM